MTRYYRMEFDCPACGVEIANAAIEDLSKPAPKPGDNGLCGHCGARLVYQLAGLEHLSARLMAEAEFEALPEYVQQNLIQTAAALQQGAIKHPDTDHDTDPHLRLGQVQRNKISQVLDQLYLVGHTLQELERERTDLCVRLTHVLSVLHHVLKDPASPAAQSVRLELEQIAAQLGGPST